MSASEITALLVQAAEVGLAVPFAVMIADALMSFFVKMLKGLRQ